MLHFRSICRGGKIPPSPSAGDWNSNSNLWKKWLSSMDSSSNSVPVIPRLTFQEVREEIKKPGSVLLDVREPDELITDGRILKEARNVPLGDVEKAVDLDDGSFNKKYGFSKPGHNDNIVIHCKAGVRAMKAAVTFNKAGYSNVKVYDGVLDWISNGGSIVK